MKHCGDLTAADLLARDTTIYRALQNQALVPQPISYQRGCHSAPHEYSLSAALDLALRPATSVPRFVIGFVAKAATCSCFLVRICASTLCAILCLSPLIDLTCGTVNVNQACR